MNPRVAGQFVGATEAFRTAGEHAAMRLFPGVGSNVSGLMFQAVKGLFTQRTLVRSGEILPSVVGDSIQQRWDPAHSRHRIGALLVLIVVVVVVGVEVVVVVVVVVMVMAGEGVIVAVMVVVIVAVGRRG